MTGPRVVRTRTELAAARAQLSGRVGVVMTMGALHAGHAALLAAARETCPAVIATVFVNPLQFGAGEDLDRYPRTFDADLALCAQHGVDIVFAPDLDTVYPGGAPAVRVAAGALGNLLEGAHRPGHFDGVLTVVAKLLHLTRPTAAFYGEKDGQQLALIRAMVRDLDFPVEIVGVPTVRDADGLALSSRNVYLSPQQRSEALALSAGLRAGVAAAASGAGADGVRRAAAEVLDSVPGLAVDYLALVDDETWAEAHDDTPAARLLVAARVGSTRLIDNVSVSLGTHVSRDAVG